MRKALIVGIDEYKSCPLKYCCNDAKAVSSILTKHADGSPNFETHLSLNISTKSDLLSKIDNCFSGDSDIALFYYAGHGIVDSVGGYLVTPDFTQYDYGVSLQEILTIVNKSKCKNRIVILDSCYSGAMGAIDCSTQNTTVINEGVTILTSTRLSEEAIEEHGHGIFTSLLLEALQGSAADITGNISPASIYSYIDKALGPWNQRPVFKTNATRFVSLRNTKPQVDLSIIRKLCTYFNNEDSKFNLDPSFEPTNSNNVAHKVIKPYANKTNTQIFSDLQKLEGIGIVVPINEEHMYFAAMNSESCVLTSIGKQYWRLVKKGYI